MIEVHSTVRAGRFVRQERLENNGRVQSWVVAGPKGAVEARGTRADEIFWLAHAPAYHPGFGMHSQLILEDPDTFYNAKCTVLEGDCSVLLVYGVRQLPEIGGDVWDVLERMYRNFLETL